CQQYSSVSYSF
nr:immunoglobulin light chain junction region [Macaca mulatta]